MGILSYRDLKVWNKSMDLVLACYQLTNGFPSSERYGLTSQLRRSAASVPANIAEGHGRDALGDYLHHLSIAKGSLTELETHLVIAQRLAYCSEPDLAPTLRLTSEIGRMLSALSRNLKKRRT